jgi:hypothetical protein
MMGPWLLSSEEWLSKVCCLFLKLWLVSDDENFHLRNSESDEPCLSKWICIMRLNLEND